MGTLVVIAGCGSTMGRNIAHVFAGAGFDLALIARSEEPLRAIADEVAVGGYDGTVEYYPGDVTQPDTTADLFGRIRSHQGDPGILVYNVATMVKTPPSALTAQEILDTLPAMFLGALYTTTEVLPAMRRAGEGTLLYTGGGFGILPATFTASHSLGKAALRNWVHNLHQELKPEGIHAATVTITRPVTNGGPYDGRTIAGHYLSLHRQPRDRWEWEVIHREL
ncbi:MAG: SDR family NAD(P)-dependent oxidoreductase [Alkalispirochaeta sp.]